MLFWKRIASPEMRFMRRTAEEIFTYVLRDMTSEAGAFFTAEDADSEGEEGRFYVWSSAMNSAGCWRLFLRTGKPF